MSTEVKCEICGHVFTSSLAKRRHKEKCSGTKWHCRICEAILPSLQSLYNHQVQCSRRKNDEEHEKRVKREADLAKKLEEDQLEHVNNDDNVGHENQLPGSDACGESYNTSERYKCGKCNKSFPNLRAFQKHRQSHYNRKTGRFICPVCQTPCRCQRDLLAHMRRDHSSQDKTGLPRMKQCHDCSESFESWHELYCHRIKHRGSTDTASRVADLSVKMPWEKDPNIDPPWVSTDEHGNKHTDTDFMKSYRDHRDTIHASHDLGNIRGIYNFPINDFNGVTEELRPQLDQILINESHAFKLNIAFGIILRNIETGEYRYYTAYYNNTLLDTPHRINNADDINGLIKELDGMSLMDILMKTGESTKWQKIFVTNVTYFVYRMGFLIGYRTPRKGKFRLPSFIRDRHCIVSLDTYKHAHKPYNDNLCIFRCLAYAVGGNKTLEKRTKLYYNQWKRYQEEEQGVSDLPNNARRFKGIYIDQLPEFEECFRVRTCVYSLNEDESCTRRYQSMLESNAPDVELNVNLNLFQKHFSLITDFSQYARKFSCRFCRRCFSRSDNMQRHEKICYTRVRYTFPGGVYTPTLSVFEELHQSLGIEVSQDKQYYPWFAVYDFESVLEQNTPDQSESSTEEEEQGNLTPGSHTHWTTTHIPVCVSVCSNVEGYNSPKCFIDEDCDNLVKRMCEYLEEIQSKTCQLAQVHWETVDQSLRDKQKEFPVSTVSSDSKGDSCTNTNREETHCDIDDELDDEDIVNEPDQDDITGEYVSPELPDSNIGGMDFQQARDIHASRVEILSKKFDKYKSVLPVLGFNSSRYDLNLIKKYFPKHLNLATDCDYVVKKTNQYTTIATNKFKFLDITNYLAAGCSYSKFLKAYNIEESKSYFPYEWFNSVSKLKEEQFPPYEAFYSTLKDCNVLNAEYETWERECGKESLKPKKGREKHEELQEIWRNRGMTKFEDFLEYYVNLDTGPFVQAAEKLQRYYFDMGVDVFKVAISAPGVARRLLFRHAKAHNKHFACFDSEQDDLYHKIKKCAFGGPSIIFKRYFKADHTFIRNNTDKICRKIAGYDCNGLYLWALGTELPVLFPVRRSRETNFKPIVSWRHLEMYEWMNWIMKEEGIHIQHKMNSSKEFPVGPYRLDGVSVNNDGSIRGFEFHGCWTHGHDPEVCSFNRGKDGSPLTSVSEKTKQQQNKKRLHTMEKEQYLRSREVDLQVIYECEFAQLKKENPSVKQHSTELLPDFYVSHPRGVSEKTILNSIESGELTGLIEVDIQVPDKWPAGKERDVSPHQYFSEMAPIFCNSDVHFDHWGPTMQTYSLSKLSGDLVDTRRLLVGGMRAKKIFLASNLLKWYLEQGLEVTHVYEVVEYRFEKCFEGFCDMISNARRDGDKEPSKEILGETCKVLGNASYGSLLLDKSKHTSVTYVHHSHNAHLAVNDPCFKSVCSLPGDIYEIEKTKKRIPLDIPIQLAFCILQSAKLKLLEFYYECLDYYVDRKDFEVSHCDTDSIYFGMSGLSLSDVVIPSKKDEFNNSIYGHCYDKDSEGNPFRASRGKWFPRECCDTHKSYDKRERGLFKLEAEGTELIALSSKTYFLERSGAPNCVKAKGINKSVLKDPKDLYSKALMEKQSGSAENIGFRAMNNTIMTYTQKRKGFNYFYVKRQVHANGIDTSPLSMTLNPWENFNTLVLRADKHCLSNDYQSALLKHGRVFRSCTQLLCYEMAMYHNLPETANDIIRARSDKKIMSLVKQIKFKPSWYLDRDEIMSDIVWQKVNNMKYRVISELRASEGKMIVQPGCSINRYFTCGLSQKMAEITNPCLFPGQDAMSTFWEQLLKNEDFMNS